jgi:hypothetical protein
VVDLDRARGCSKASAANGVYRRLQLKKPSDLTAAKDWGLACAGFLVDQVGMGGCLVWSW